MNARPFTLVFYLVFLSHSLFIRRGYFYLGIATGYNPSTSFGSTMADMLPFCPCLLHFAKKYPNIKKQHQIPQMLNYSFKLCFSPSLPKSRVSYLQLWLNFLIQTSSQCQCSLPLYAPNPSSPCTFGDVLMEPKQTWWGGGKCLACQIRPQTFSISLSLSLPHFLQKKRARWRKQESEGSERKTVLAG